jgi:hypothetical protein
VNREEMDAAHRRALLTPSRWWDPASPPQLLLDSLRKIAEQHADDILHQENGVSGPAPTGPQQAGSVIEVESLDGLPMPARTTAPRRRPGGKAAT